MSWLSNLYRKMFPPPIPIASGADKLVAMLTEQVCNWFETPIQKPPAVIVYDNSRKAEWAERKRNGYVLPWKPAAIYDIRTDTISVYGSENVTTAILAHEVAHAVVYRLNGKITPRMHEILAGYAEFEVRKAMPDGK